MDQLKAAVTPDVIEKLSTIEDRLKPTELYPLLKEIVTHPTQSAAALAMNLSVPKIFDIIDRGRKGYQDNPDYFGCPVSDDVKSLLTEYNPLHKFSDDEHRVTLDTILEHGSVKAAIDHDGQPWRARLRNVREKAARDTEFRTSLNPPQRELTLYGLGIDNKPFSWQIRSIMEVAGAIGVGETSRLLGYNRKTDFVNTLKFWQELGDRHPELGLTPDLFAIDELKPRHHPHPGHEKILVAVAQSERLTDAAAGMDVKPATFYNWFRATRIELQKPGQLDQLDWGAMKADTQGKISNIDDVLALMVPRQQYAPTFKVSDLVAFARDVAADQPKSLYEYARNHDLSQNNVYYKDFILKGLVQLGIMSQHDIPEGYPDVNRYSKSSPWMKQQALNAVSLVGHYDETAEILNIDASTLRYRTLAALALGYEMTSDFDRNLASEQQKLLARGPEAYPAEPMLWLRQSDTAPPSVIFTEPFKPAVTLQPLINQAGLYEIRCLSSNNHDHDQDVRHTLLARGGNAYQAWDILGKTLTEIELSDAPSQHQKCPGDIIEVGLCQIGRNAVIRPFKTQGHCQSLPINTLAQQLTQAHHDAGYPWYGPQFQSSAIRYQRQAPGAAVVLALSQELGAVVDPVSAQDFADAAARMGRTIPEETLNLTTRLEQWREKNRQRRKSYAIARRA